jgi:hypothetical protein
VTAVVITTMLSPSETAALNGYERVIERGMSAFYDAGRAMLAIREQRLYRATHDTFSDYCLQRWGLSDRHVRRLIVAHDVVAGMVALTGPMGPVPVSERQVRELVDLEPADAVAVYAEAVERARATGTAVTAAAVRRARDRHEQDAAPTRAQTLGARSRNPRRRPLTDDMDSLVHDANKLERKIRRLLDDDRLDRNAEFLAGGRGQDLKRLDDALIRLLVRVGVAE